MKAHSKLIPYTFHFLNTSGIVLLVTKSNNTSNRSIGLWNRGKNQLNLLNLLWNRFCWLEKQTHNKTCKQYFPAFTIFKTFFFTFVKTKQRGRKQKWLKLCCEILNELKYVKNTFVLFFWDSRSRSYLISIIRFKFPQGCLIGELSTTFSLKVFNSFVVWTKGRAHSEVNFDWVWFKAGKKNNKWVKFKKSWARKSHTKRMS